MKGLVVLSGGMDSTVALYLAKKMYKEVEAISFNYDSKHNDEEHLRAEKTCKKLNVKWQRVNLPFINDLFKSNLLKSGGEIPEGHYAEPIMKKTVVPFRNGIMLSIAAGYAESIGASEIVLGNHFGDHAVYPDCRKEFIDPMTEAIKKGTYDKIRINAPFTTLTKTEIASIGRRLFVNWEDTYSCYKGNPIHCGRCSTCYERREAFIQSGVSDPTEYYDKTPFETLREEYAQSSKK